MTKDEIKKALKTCSVDSCTDCPYDNKGLYCCGKLKRDALALITEQENEIKKQNGRVKCLKTRLANKMVLLSNVEDLYESETQKLKEEKQELKTALKQAEDNYSRAFERLKTRQREIERLKAENKKDFDNFVKVNDELLKANIKLSVDKKQAQIDILKRLKVFSEPYPNSWGIYVIDVYHIDELIKEVENEQKD